MNQGIIGINLLFEDGESVFVKKSLFSNLYIANIDEKANEIPYDKLELNKLYANFFTLRISQLINEENYLNILKTVYDKKSLSEVELLFQNKKVSFYLASDADPFLHSSINHFDKSFFHDEDLCMLICPFNIKYSKHLFT